MVNNRSEAFSLSAQTIDEVSALCVQTLSEAGADKKDILRIRLSLEEILGIWLGSLEGAVVQVDSGQKFGRAFLKISVDGPAMGAWDSEAAILSSHMLSQAGLSFTYAYKNGKNCLTCNPRKANAAMGQVAVLLGAVILAGVLGWAVRLFPAIEPAVLSVTEPLFNTILGALRAVSSPIVFLAVCCGMVSMGDLTLVGKLGKKLLVRIITGIFALGVLMALLGCLMFPVTMEAGNAGSGDFSGIYQMVLAIVPSDIVSPFLNGNALQLVFLGVCLGAALLILGERVSAVQSFLMQTNETVQFLMSALEKIVPLFVFLGLFDLALSGVDSGMSVLLRVFAIAIPGCFVMALFYVFLGAARLSVSPVLLLKKLLPTFLIILTTASSAAAMATNLETCVKELGIPKKIADFAIPLGQVLYKPGFVVGIFPLALCTAQYYNVPITPQFLLMGILTIGLLAIAVPTIPGGPLSVFTVLFAQLGIPNGAIALAVSAAVILDFFMTSAGTSCMQIQVALAADSVGMLDKTKLKKSLS